MALGPDVRQQQRAPVAPALTCENDPVTEDMGGYEALRESFEKLMREHPYNITVIDEPPPPKITARKAVCYLPIADELLHPERYPTPHISRRVRFWWAIAGWRERVHVAWSVLRGKHDCGDD